MFTFDRQAVRHWGGFLVSGGAAFLSDAALTLLFVRGIGLDAFSGRLLAILGAMVVAWLMHRRITFNVPDPPSLKEFVRFAAVAWSANALNYGIYVAILLLWPATPVLGALIASTAVAMVFSYLGFRFGVFKHTP